MIFLYLGLAHTSAICNMLSGVWYGTIYYYVDYELDNLNAEDQANPRVVASNYCCADLPLPRYLSRQMLYVPRASDTQLRLCITTKGVSALMKLKSLKLNAANWYDTMHDYLLNTTRDMTRYISTFKSFCWLFGSELTLSYTSWLIIDGDSTIQICSPSPTPSVACGMQKLRKPYWGR